MKVLKLNSLFLGLLAMSLGTWSTANAADDVVTVNQTFEDTSHGNWDGKLFKFTDDNLNKIAEGLGLTKEQLLAKAGTDVILYSVKDDGTLVAPSDNAANNCGESTSYKGDWHYANGYSVGGNNNKGGFYHVVKYSDFSIGMGQNAELINANNPYLYPHFNLVAKYGEKSVNINITYKVNNFDITAAGDYSLNLPYANTATNTFNQTTNEGNAYGCSYINIDQQAIADALGLSLSDFKANYKNDNTGTVTLNTYTAGGNVKENPTGTGEGEYKGAWVNANGLYQDGWNNGYVFYAYDPAGRIGFGQKEKTVTSESKTVCRIVFKNSENNKYAVVFVTYNATAPEYKLTTADKDFYSLNLGFAATIPAGIEAYTGSLDEANNVVKLNKITTDYIPANTSVLVKSENAGEYTFARADKAEAPVADNVIQGVLTDTKASLLSAEGKKALQFGIKDGVVGFRLPTADNIIKANRAYILVDAAAAAKPFGIEMGNEATGITTVKGEKVDNVSYNIAGQRVNNNAKGLVIRGGKKFFNK